MGKITKAESQARSRRKLLKKKKKAIIAKHPDAGYTMDMCLAKRRSKKTGKIRYCKKPALKNGRCRLHGKGGAPIRHGMYSKYLPSLYKERYEEFLKDPNILELKGEVALLRLVTVRINELIDELKERRDEKGVGHTDSNLKDEIELIERLGDSAEKIARVVEKARKAGEGMLTIEGLQQCLTQIAYLININIAFCPKCGVDLTPVKAEVFEAFKELKVPSREG